MAGGYNETVMVQASSAVGLDEGRNWRRERGWTQRMWRSAGSGDRERN